MAEAFTQGDLRSEGKVALEGGGVSISDRNITGLHGDELLVGLEVEILREDTRTHELFLEDGNEIEEVLGLATTYIIYRIRGNGQAILSLLTLRCALHHTDDTLDNVINIGEVALAVAVVVDLNGLALEQLVRKTEIGHVWTSCRAINREEAQTCGGDVIELGIAVGHEFVGLLGGCVKGDGVIHAVIGRERDFLVAAVDAGAGGVNQVFHRSHTGDRPRCAIRDSSIGVSPHCAAAGFEDVVEADEVGLDIGIGVGDAIAHTSLGCEVDNDLGIKERSAISPLIKVHCTLGTDSAVPSEIAASGSVPIVPGSVPIVSSSFKREDLREGS